MEGNYSDEERSKQLEKLAVFTHGSLTTLHAIGCMHHILRHEKGGKKHVVIHGSALAYSLLSFYEHYKFYQDQA